jgi:hypothetical protein
MRRISVCGATVALLTWALVSAGAARAGVWTYDTCSRPDGAAASIVGWATSAFGSVGAGGDTDSCGTAGGGLGATQNGLVTPGDGPSWVFTAPAGDTIAGGVVDATLSVPQGEDWIATPNDTNTGADDFAYCAANSPEGGAVCDQPTAWPITHPGGTTIYAVARCYQGNCPSVNTEVASLTISSAQIELADSSLPAASGFSGPLLAVGAHGVADLLFTASDPRVAPGSGGGPGVYSVTAKIDGTAVYSGTPNPNGGACVPLGGGPSGGGLMFDAEQPCPPTTTVDIPVNTTGLANGGHDLTVSITDAAGNSATVLDQEISIANPVTGTTTAPGHSPHREVNARFKLVWKVSGSRTRIQRVFDVHLPRHGSVAVECLGHRCPRLRLRRESTRRARRLWHELEHIRFRSGQRLVITISAPRLRPEPIRLTFRDRRTPAVKRLKKTPR